MLRRQHRHPRAAAASIKDSTKKQCAYNMSHVCMQCTSSQRFSTASTRALGMALLNPFMCRSSREFRGRWLMSMYRYTDLLGRPEDNSAQDTEARTAHLFEHTRTLYTTLHTARASPSHRHYVHPSTQLLHARHPQCSPSPSGARRARPRQAWQRPSSLALARH